MVDLPDRNFRRLIVKRQQLFRSNRAGLQAILILLQFSPCGIQGILLVWLTAFVSGCFSYFDRRQSHFTIRSPALTMNNASKSDSAVNCGNCDGLFRLPRGISGKATLVCPHCDTELKVSDLLDMLPVAKVTQDTGHDDEPDSGIKIETEPPQRSKYAVDEQSYSIPKPLKTALRKHHHSGSSSRHKSTKRAPFARKKTGPADIVKMVFGGLLAIPIAQIVLWWVFGVDPFRMVDRVYPYVPAIIPHALAPVELQTEDENAKERSRDMPPGQSLNDTGVPIRLK
jgi:hypothetical protein